MEFELWGLYCIVLEDHLSLEPSDQSLTNGGSGQ